MRTNNIFFTADTHFGHTNIIKYCKRPFDSVEEHDEVLIKNWNSRVGKGDDVYHLGDFAFGSQKRVKEIVSRLNGRIFLLRGNHDKPINGDVVNSFVWVKDYHEMKTDEFRKVCLFHYPMRTWRSKHYGSVHLHGHCHGNLNHYGEKNIFDVGVDCWDYAPVSVEEINELVSEQNNG